MSRIINTEKQLINEEREVKPNKHAIWLSIVFLVGIIACWVLNEFHIFRVETVFMRLAVFGTVLFAGTPLVMVLIKKDFLTKPFMKYLFVISICFSTFVITVLMPFHTTLLLLVPMFAAMLYRSIRIGIIGFGSSIFCTITYLVVSYLMHNWQPSFFVLLIQIVTDTKIVLPDPATTISLVNIGYILLFLVLPKLIVIVSLSILMFRNIKIASQNVDNQVLVNRVSERDLLTGFYNQNYYKNVLDDAYKYNISVGIMFFDVNGLKIINDQYGHEYGDLLLKRCALSVRAICDDNSFAFRIGGDEFLLIIEDGTEEMINEKKKIWEEELVKINEENKHLYDGLKCSMAMGSIVGEFNDLLELVHKADIIMYDNKQKMKGNI